MIWIPGRPNTVSMPPDSSSLTRMSAPRARGSVIQDAQEIADALLRRVEGPARDTPRAGEAVLDGPLRRGVWAEAAREALRDDLARDVADHLVDRAQSVLRRAGQEVDPGGDGGARVRDEVGDDDDPARKEDL